MSEPPSDCKIPKGYTIEVEGKPIETDPGFVYYNEDAGKNRRFFSVCKPVLQRRSSREQFFDILLIKAKNRATKESGGKIEDYEFVQIHKPNCNENKVRKAYPEYIRFDRHHFDLVDI